MKLAICFALVLCLVPTLGYAGVQGKYTADTKKLAAEMGVAIKQLPKKRRVFARMALEMAKSMKSELILSKNGKVSYSMSMKVFGKLHTKKGLGFWKKKKNGFYLEIKSQDKKGKQMTDVLLCTVVKTGLACKHAKKSNKKTIFYNKTK